MVVLGGLGSALAYQRLPEVAAPTAFPVFGPPEQKKRQAEQMGFTSLTCKDTECTQ